MLDRRIEVYNRTDGSLAYRIPSTGVIRHWRRPGDYLNISIKELIELKTAPGGMRILTECVLIKDIEALKLILPDEDIEPEYHYGIDEIDTLLYEAELDTLLDALDYAPKGVLDIIRKKSTEKLPNTTDKIEAINRKFDIDINKIHDLSIGSVFKEEVKTEKRTRRSKPLVEVEEEETKEEPSLPKYNIIEKN